MNTSLTPILEAYCREAVASGNPEAIKQAAEWAGTTAESLKAAVGLTPEPAQAASRNNGHDHTGSPMLVCLADVQAQPVRWLWPGRIALGKLTLIAGDPGLGKSFLTLDIASRVSTGAGWPDRPGERFEPGGVVLLSAEDDIADTIRPRLDAAGADVNRITALQGVEHRDADTGATIKAGFTLADVPVLEEAIKATPDCRLVVVDPISAYMGGSDSHVNAEVRAALVPLSDLAARHGLAVLAVTHLRKGEGAAIYRAMGSLAFVAAARAAWAVAKDEEDLTGRRRLFLPIKNNIGNDRNGLAFELRDSSGTGTPSLAWEAEPVTVKADDALAPPSPGKPGPAAQERDTAAAWLRNALAGGPRLGNELIEEWTNGKGGSKRTLDRARQKLEIEAYRESVPGPWWWKLPAQGCQPSGPDPIHQQPGDLGNLAENKVNPEGGAPKVAKLFEKGETPTDPRPEGPRVIVPDDLGAGCSDPVEDKP